MSWVQILLEVGLLLILLTTLNRSKTWLLGILVGAKHVYKNIVTLKLSLLADVSDIYKLLNTVCL